MRVLVALGVALLNILAAQSVAAQGQRRPNIVIIFADDLGYGDVIEELDWSVGKVLDALRAAPVERNTLVLLASANRPPASAARSPR